MSRAASKLLSFRSTAACAVVTLAVAPIRRADGNIDIIGPAKDKGKKEDPAEKDGGR